MPILVQKFHKPESGTFLKEFRQLDPQIQTHFENVIEEIVNDSVLPSRRLKKLKDLGRDDLYSVRLGRSHRFIFQVLPSGIGVPRLIDTRSNVYKRVRRMQFDSKPDDS